MTRSIAILAALLSAAAPAVIRASDCPISEPFKTGEVKENEVVEASGLACSRRNPGVLYTHNDHNGDDDTAKIFAFLEDGEQVGGWFRSTFLCLDVLSSIFVHKQPS